ncbi:MULTISPECIES: Rieske (2Fe-2S) protein [unclassified Streptomyces]|uniref:Rieske (2Fe-2S) protein n=1 Tax=unclassified Streptomyces TaxID=2593676 RepID=UPI00093FAABF|nr:Rieske (2Fe-2S) protein [Streptomyces sp. TSRI0281]OKI40724.1 hypothetical protein A6A29_38685 [Streptomyces sp. TSRI0281]
MTRLKDVRRRLAEGGLLLLASDDGPYVARLVAGEPMVHRRLCPHRGAPLDDAYVIGRTLVCSWHRSVFHCVDGRKMHGPTGHALPVIAASFEQDDLLIERDGLELIEQQGERS